MGWNDFSSELKDALSTIIHSSTLKTLSLKGFRVPITLFLGVNLTKLKLTDHLLPDESDVAQSRLLIKEASDGVATTASHTVVDHCVWTCLHGTRFPTSAYFPLFQDLDSARSH